MKISSEFLCCAGHCVRGNANEKAPRDQHPVGRLHTAGEEMQCMCNPKPFMQDEGRERGGRKDLRIAILLQLRDGE